MLIQGFLSTRALTPTQIVISTKTKEKVSALIDSYPDIRLMQDNRLLAALCDIIIIGVRPFDLLPVLQEIRDIKESNIHLVSLASCVRTQVITHAYPGRISRILPSICSTVHDGISLCYHHSGVRPEEIAYIESLFCSVSTVMRVDEELFEPAGDLMSCGPALITQMLVEMAAAGARHSTISQEECLQMAVRTAQGTIRLLQEGVTPDELIRLVATPGGITEEGVNILKKDLPSVFDRLFDTTLAKHTLVREHVSAQWQKLNENQ